MQVQTVNSFFQDLKHYWTAKVYIWNQGFSQDLIKGCAILLEILKLGVQLFTYNYIYI